MIEISKKKCFFKEIDYSEVIKILKHEVRATIQCSYSYFRMAQGKDERFFVIGYSLARGLN